MDNFHKRLQYVAEVKGLSQAELARKMGKDPSTINAWWKGERAPRSINIMQICQVIGCSKKWLNEGKGEPFPEENSISPVHETAETNNQSSGYRKWHLGSDTDNSKQSEGSPDKNFKKLCAANFDLVFDYIAEEYGTESIDIQMFLDDLIDVHHPFRIWLHEKKAERKSNKAGLQKDISTAEIK